MVPLAYPWALSVFAQCSSSAHGAKKAWIGCQDGHSQMSRPPRPGWLSARDLSTAHRSTRLLTGPGTRYRSLTVLMQSEASLPLRLALIGMSGAGKTFWTKKLSAEGWNAICCDDCIERKLAPRLAAGGYSGIDGVAAWMGWPDAAKYAQREAQYLEEEIHALGEVLTSLEQPPEKPL